MASFYGKVAVVRVLVARGADPDIVSGNGRTALMLAFNSLYDFRVRALIRLLDSPHCHGPCNDGLFNGPAAGLAVPQPG